ncbi:MAG: hypothetical protein K5886_04390 [Lachnospiraceae bacterium]|nr:hypothetical protein [Lachnospiraceae bacterium]
MLTYNTGIYKKILEPLNIRYYVPLERSGNRLYIKPTSRESVWEFLFPAYIRNSMSLSRSSFSAMNQGKSDIKNSTDAARERMKKVLLTDGDRYFSAMGEHLRSVIRENAAIGSYVQKTEKDLKFHELSKIELDAFVMDNSEETEQEFRRKLESLSGILSSNWSDIEVDPRYEQSFFDRLKEINDKDPVKVLEFLCISSLFHIDDDDRGFFKSIEKYYIFSDSEDDSTESLGKNGKGEYKKEDETNSRTGLSDGWSDTDGGTNRSEEKKAINDLFGLLNPVKESPESDAPKPHETCQERFGRENRKKDANRKIDEIRDQLGSIFKGL